MEKVHILCPGHNQGLILAAAAAALGGRHMICAHNLDDVPFLGQELSEKIYTLTDISIREIRMPKHYGDKVPSGMSPSYHHILSKQRKKKGATP